MTSQIERVLNSIGKACFVRYYMIFADENYSNSDIAIILADENGYTDKAPNQGFKGEDSHQKWMDMHSFKNGDGVITISFGRQR